MSRHMSPAMRRYMKRLSVFMVIYIALIFVVGWTFRHAPPAAPWSVGLAILPALPIIGVFWTVFRLLVEETDEYVRMLFVRQSLFATGFCLTVMTIWEFLQNYEIVPTGNGGFGAAFFWFAGLGFGALWNKFTMDDGGCA